MQLYCTLLLMDWVALMKQECNRFGSIRLSISGHHCQYSWVSQQGNPREMQVKSSVGFQQGNSDTWFSCWKPSAFSCKGNPKKISLHRKSSRSRSLLLFLVQETQQFWQCTLLAEYFLSSFQPDGHSLVCVPQLFCYSFLQDRKLPSAHACAMAV